MFPFHSELWKKTKSRLAHFSLTQSFLSPPTFWEARDQPEPGFFFPRMKDPGNEVGGRLRFLKSGQNERNFQANLEEYESDVLDQTEIQ